jgi:tRNA-guanine transglycosylase
MKFRILKRSKKSRARLGVISTPHGDLQTPAIVTVATQASIKTLTSTQAAEAGSPLLICNTLHLHLKPGEAVVKKAGGLHKFMNWHGPLMTDSGGYQVLSLGFGRDHGDSKFSVGGNRVTKGQQPANLKITEEGVAFRSYVDGQKLFMRPEDSIRIQEDLGADLIFAFDECTSPSADREYTRLSMERTHRWADRCLAARTRKDQAMYGIVQGGRFKDLRQESARFVASRPFEGVGIGGEFGTDKRLMTRMMRWITDFVPEDRPRHLLGVGRPEDILPAVRSGVDTFDCTVPTQYARHGTAFAGKGRRLNLANAEFKLDQRPLDAKCTCFVCREHSRSYLCHLLRSKEITGLALLTFHNLHWFNAQLAEVRKKLRNGDV